NYDLSHHPNDERLYNELNGHFFVITDPSIQEIIDGNNNYWSRDRSNMIRHICWFQCSAEG
ncbi:2966_t:CDS:2, partial [Gigaspora margarita]